MEKILNQKQMQKMILRISQKIICEFRGGKLNDIVMLGIQLKGVPLANRIAGIIAQLKNVSVPVGTIDISMYRDDIGICREISKTYETYIPFDIEERAIILVDDVLHTGRTIRAALDAVTDYGRPSLIRLAVLIDRMDREYPISADYVGMKKRFPSDKRILVRWEELGDNDAVYLKKLNKMKRRDK